MMKVGMVGAGHIAGKMARTIAAMPDFTNYAIASRDLAKAQAFASEFGMQKAYGSYEELYADPEVELVYIATPHSHHFAQARMALEAGKPVLCEKAFTANAREAESLFELSRIRGVFICEAVWTRFMPLSMKIRELIEGGAIGRPRQLSATLCYPMEQKERILRPELCGGVLLDLSIYGINFARMYFGNDIVRVDSSCVKGETGVDMYETITLGWRDGRMANLVSSAYTRCNRLGLICGDEGYIEVENMNIVSAVRVFKDYRKVAEFFPPETQINGYEYELRACCDAVRNGWVESPYMPHSETLEIMKMMDALRAEWGVRYPMDE